MIALMAAGLLEDAFGPLPPGTKNKDMCVWGFQSIPPPPGDDGQFHVPRNDADRAWELFKLANSRFQAQMGFYKNSGSVAFGGSTLGARASKEFCDFHLNAETNATYCNSTISQNSTLNWPAAVTMFKVCPISALHFGSPISYQP
jgi:hypothetical protein